MPLDQSAARALEFALLASFMGVVVAIGVTVYGTGLCEFFSNVGIHILKFAT